MPALQEKLVATMLPERYTVRRPPVRRLPVQTAGWEGLLEFLGGGISGFVSVKEAEAQKAAAEAELARLELERVRLAQTPTVKFGDFLRKYWPHLTVATAGIVTLALVFRKKK